MRGPARVFSDAPYNHVLYQPGDLGCVPAYLTGSAVGAGSVGWSVSLRAGSSADGGGGGGGGEETTVTSAPRAALM